MSTTVLIVGILVLRFSICNPILQKGTFAHCAIRRYRCLKYSIDPSSVMAKVVVTKHFTTSGAIRRHLSPKQSSLLMLSGQVHKSCSSKAKMVSGQPWVHRAPEQQIQQSGSRKLLV